MNSKSKTVAQMAGALAANAKVEQEVQEEIANSSLVSHLLSLRAARGLTQDQVAESMGCDPSKISRLEAGNDLNLKWTDAVGYVRALKYNMCVLFEDPSLPAAERIKECVSRIHNDLEALSALAEQVGGNDQIAQKIHQFSGEVLLNFLIRHKSHSSRLNAVVNSQETSPVQVTTAGDPTAGDAADKPAVL